MPFCAFAVPLALPGCKLAKKINFRLMELQLFWGTVRKLQESPVLFQVSVGFLIVFTSSVAPRCILLLHITHYRNIRLVFLPLFVLFPFLSPPPLPIRLLLHPCSAVHPTLRAWHRPRGSSQLLQSGAAASQNHRMAGAAHQGGADSWELRCLSMCWFLFHPCHLLHIRGRWGAWILSSSKVFLSVHVCFVIR